MKINAIQKYFGSRLALNTGEMKLCRQTVYALIGANGSGKSTFCRILSGLLPSDNHLSALPGKEQVRYLPQHPYAFRLSTEKNIRVAGADRQKADALMSQLKLDPLRKTGAHRLSGGERARMALARVLMEPCDLLILDEPTAAMDMEATALSEEAVRAYRDASGAAVLLVTHNIQQARRMGQKLIFFHEGTIKEAGDCEACLRSPATEELRRFLDFYG